MNGYQHLGLDDRRQIYQLAATGRSMQQIAAALQRHRSTIYRELKHIGPGTTSGSPEPPSMPAICTAPSPRMTICARSWSGVSSGPGRRR